MVRSKLINPNKVLENPAGFVVRSICFLEWNWKSKVWAVGYDVPTVQIKCAASHVPKDLGEDLNLINEMNQRDEPSWVEAAFGLANHGEVRLKSKLCS